MTWQITNRGTAGAAATVSATASTNGGYVARLRSLTATLSGTAAGTAQLVVRDGATGVGTIIFQADLYTAANSRDSIILDQADLRASLTNALTIEFVAGTTSDFQSVNAQGDYVPAGQPYGI